MTYKEMELLQYMEEKRDQAFNEWRNCNKEENPKQYGLKYNYYLRLENMVETLHIVMDKAKNWDDTSWQRELNG